MVLPVFVDGAQNDVAFQPFKRVRALEGVALGVGVAHALDDEVRGAFVAGGKQLVRREAQRERRVEPADEIFERDAVDVGFFVGGQRGVHAFVEFFVDEGEKQVARFVGLQRFVADAVNDFALLVEDVVVLQRVFAIRVMDGLDAALRGFDGAVQQRMLQRLAFDEGLLQHAGDDAGVGEEAHQVVFERNEELRAARVALAGTAPAQLAVDAARFVALGAEHEEPAELAHAFAELDVGPAARHVGGDGHGAALTRLRDDLRFDFVILRVQHVVRNAGVFEAAGKHFGGLDARGADEHRLSALVRLFDFLDGFGVFFAARLENHVVLVDADAGLVRRDGDDAEAVDVVKFSGFGFRRSRHSREFFVHAEIILNRDGGVSLRFLFDLHAFLRLDRLVQPVAPAATGHDAPGVFVDDHHLVVLDDVMDVLLEKRIGAQKLGNAVNVLARADEAVFRLLLELGALLGGKVFARVDGDEFRRNVGQDERVGIVRAQRVAAELRQVGLAALFVDGVIKLFLDLETAFPVERVHHFRVEGVELFAPFAVFHHLEELLVARRAELDLQELDQPRLLGAQIVVARGALEQLPRGFHERVAQARLLLDDFPHAGLELVERLSAVFLHGTGNDQRRARLVDEDGVDFVDDAIVMVALHLLGDGRRHAVVAQIIEAELGSRAVSDVALVGFAALVRRHGILNAADRQPEKFVKMPHPLRVAARQIVVDRDELAVSSRERVEVKRERRHQRLALARRHFRDFVAVKRDSADELNVEMHHVPRQLVVADDRRRPAQTPRGVLHDGEGLRQQLIQRLAFLEALHQLRRFRLQRLVGQFLVLGFQRVDFFDDRSALSDELPVVASRENLENG